MRELLLAFILALVVGSIINGMQLNKPPETQPNTTVPLTVPSHPEDPSFAALAIADDSNFNEKVLASQKPALVFCYAPENISCERMVPLIATLAQERSGSINVFRLNVMDNPFSSHHYEITSLPTYLYFKGGQLERKGSGVLSKSELEAPL